MCDGVPLERVARDHGTPLYVYSAESIRRSYRELDEAFAVSPAPDSLRPEGELVASRSSACSARLGSAVDANSIGEVELAMRAGFIRRDIVFSGVGKSPDEIERAVQLGLKAINAESAGELERIDRAAQAQGRACQGRAPRESRTSTPVPIRTSPPACTSTSSACRSSRRPPSIAG